MAKNIIEDYLVSIGCQVNDNQFKQADKKLKNIGDNLKKIFGIITTGTAAAVGAMVGLTAAIGPVGRALGNITLGVDKLALNLHTTTRNARSLKTVMDAMGLDSLQDLAEINLIPEQRRQFMELRKVAAENAPSMQAREGLDELKKLGFEFQKFQVRLEGLGNEFLGGLGQALKEPLFKKVPQLLEVLLDLIKVIANEVVLAAKKFGSYKNLNDLNTRGYDDAGKAFRKALGMPEKKAANWGELIQNITGHGGAKLNWNTKDKSSPAIEAFVNEFRAKERYDIISASPDHRGGHARRSKHYTGNALDIGVAGKSISSIADLVQSALKVKNTKNVNLELTNPDTYQGVMNALSLRGVKDKRISHFITPQTRGSHIHVGVGNPTDNIRRLADKVKPKGQAQPLGLGGVPGGAGTEVYGQVSPQGKQLSMNVNIHINGAKDSKAVGDEVIARLTPLMNSRDARGFA